MEGEREGMRMGKEESCPTARFQEGFGQADKDSSSQRHLLDESCMLQDWACLCKLAVLALAGISLWEV